MHRQCKQSKCTFKLTFRTRQTHFWVFSFLAKASVLFSDESHKNGRLKGFLDPFMWRAFPRVPFWQTHTRPHSPKLPLPRVRTHTQVGVKMVRDHKQCWKQSSLWLSPSYVTRMETDVQKCKAIHRRAHRLSLTPLSSQSCLDLLQCKTWVPEYSQNSYNAVPFSCFQMSRFSPFSLGGFCLVSVFQGGDLLHGDFAWHCL